MVSNKTPDYAEWEKRFRQELRDNDCEKRFREIARNEWESETALINLYGYASGQTPPSFAGVLRRFSGLSSEMSRVAKKIVGLADELTPLCDVLGVAEQAFNFQLTAANLERDLRSYAAWLEFVRPFLSKKLSRRNLDRNFLLVNFVNYVREVTGEPHYADIAALLTLAYSAAGQDKPVEEDTVRKLVTGFEERNPGLLRAYLYRELQSSASAPPPPPPVPSRTRTTPNK